MLESFMSLLFCIGVPAVLLLALLVWLARRPAGQRTVNPYVQRPDAGPISPASLAAFDAMVARWVAEERLSPAVGKTVRDLIAADYAAAGFGALQPAGPAPVAAAAPTPAPAPAVAPAAPLATPSPTPLATVAAPPAAEVSTPPPAPRTTRRSLGAALLALGTRRALLYLGSFLLLVSSLTLVVFNWASFPPIVQFAILAGTTMALWGAGAWMARQPTLGTAGANLQAVAALLVPVVGFALSRPGLLDLAPRPAWQLVSALSLVLYLLAAWRTWRAFYSAAAVLAALSLIFAAPQVLDPGWKSAVATGLLAALLALTTHLRAAGVSGPATGVRWVSLIGAPLLTLVAAALYLADLSSGAACCAALLAATTFCVLAYRAEGHRAWLWAAVALPPLAVQAALNSAGVALRVHALALGLSALLYLWLSAGAERRLRLAAAPCLSAALVLGGLALPLAASSLAAARLALPPLVALGASALWLIEAGRLAWLGERRYGLASAGLGGAGALLLGWVGALLAATELSSGQIGLVLLPLAALCFAGARWWPGQLRAGYDGALQTLGALAVLGAGLLTLEQSATRLAGALLLTLIFGAQAGLRRRWPWAAFSLGAGLFAAAIALNDTFSDRQLLQAATLAALALSAGYTLAGECLRRTSHRYWSWPALAWGGLAALVAGGLALPQSFIAHPLASLTFLGLAGLAALHSARWQRGSIGFLAAPLLSLSALIAAVHGFFSGWQPTSGDLAPIICGLAVGLALLGQVLRRVGRAYALPYELVAFALLPLAPLAALGDVARLSVIWLVLCVLYGLALWRYRLPWMLALAIVAGDLALLHATVWRFPGGPPERAGLLLAGAVWLQALASAWLRRRPAPWAAAGTWGYLGAFCGGAGALALAASSDDYLAAVVLLFAGLLAVLAQVEQRASAAWGSLALAVVGAWLLHISAGMAGAWAAAWLVLELMAVSLLGWGAIRAGQTLWRQVTGPGALAAGGLLTVATLALGGGLPPLSFALASLGLLLATLAVRERTIVYAYGTGAAFVGAVLSQLAGWGVRELQWYVLPAGVYLLALADGLRRFQGQRRVSQLIEAAAVVLLLGASFGQALRPEGGLTYSLLLFGEALLVAAYGALARLRVPFLGGIAFFVAGVIWMSIDTLRLANQWILLGIVGLLMVLAYVLLERHQERLVRAGSSWAAQLRTWK